MSRAQGPRFRGPTDHGLTRPFSVVRVLISQYGEAGILMLLQWYHNFRNISSNSCLPSLSHHVVTCGISKRCSVRTDSSIVSLTSKLHQETKGLAERENCISTQIFFSAPVCPLPPPSIYGKFSSRVHVFLRISNKKIFAQNVETTFRPPVLWFQVIASP